MKCPNCGHDLVLDGYTEDPEHRKEALVCRACNLAGPRAVLEGLAARLAPAGVLEAAEKLLRSVRAPLAVTSFTDAYARLLRMKEAGDGRG